ncbi:MAG: hypothetical protein V3V92_06560 [Candidatus Hydrothermarchaeales archaeon]
MVIRPTNDNIVSGAINLMVTQVPSGTELVGFAIQGPGIEDIGKTGPNLGLDGDGGDGWSYIFDTSKYANGVYDISGIALPSGGGAPLGAAYAQVIIQN